MRRLALSIIVLVLLLTGFVACQEQVEHTAPAINDRDCARHGVMGREYADLRLGSDQVSYRDRTLGGEPS